MDATSVIRHLLETPDDAPFDIGPLERYTGPIEFDNNIKDIVDRARALKQQAEQAGVLKLLANYKPHDIDSAFLVIAVEQANSELLAPAKIARLLKREMHSVWR